MEGCFGPIQTKVPGRRMEVLRVLDHLYQTMGVLESLVLRTNPRILGLTVTPRKAQAKAEAKPVSTLVRPGSDLVPHDW